MIFEDSLISRFDLIFLIRYNILTISRDSNSVETDERIASSVLRNILEKVTPIKNFSNYNNLLVVQPDIYKDKNNDDYPVFFSKHEMTYIDIDG